MMIALDLLRTLGWGIVDFIFSSIDLLFKVLQEINAFDIIDSISNENMFIKFYTAIIAIAITVFGLFSIWGFVKKIIDPEESLSIEQIVREIIKCGVLIIMSTFIFVNGNTLAISLSQYTSSIFTSNNTSIGDNMLLQYVTYSDSYKVSEDFKEEDISKFIKNDNFTDKKMYNDTFVTDEKWILPDEKEYKYSINWIMSLLVGAFFLYALFFSGMMLARRQIEFLFLFTIAPIVFATSVGNKQRRGAVYELLVSLILQAGVVMLIIGLTALLMSAIQNTTFFSDTIMDTIIKSILYIGCGTFLLTGSQVVNKFIGNNVSANSGREHLMSMMGFGNMVRTGAVAGGFAGAGASLVTVGAGSTLVGKFGGDNAVSKIGNTINNFGKTLSSKNEVGSSLNKIGNTISGFGKNIENSNLSTLGKSLRGSGYSQLGKSANILNPLGNITTSRYRRR